MTLRRKTLFLSLTALLIPLMIMTFLTNRIVRNIYLEKNIDAELYNIRKSMLQFDQFCNSLSQNLSNTANSTNLKIYRSIRFSDLHDELLLMNYTRLFNVELTSFLSYSSDIVRSLMLLWEDMSTPIVKGSPSFPYTSDYRENAIYQAARANLLKTVWTYSETEQGTPFITLATAVLDGYSTQIAGVLLMEIRIDILERYFAAASNTHAHTLILDQNQLVLYDSADTLSSTFINWPFLKNLEEKDNGFITEVDGERYLIAYEKSIETGWIALTLTPYSYITDAMEPLQRITYLTVLFSACASVFIATLIYSMFYKPIKGLMRVITRFGDGDLNARITVRKHDEIAMLFHRFNTMANHIVELVQKIEHYQQREKMVEILFLQAQIIPHFLSNSLCNIAALARLGKKEEIIQMSTALERLLRIASVREGMIPLTDELCYILEYIRIMQLRYKKNIVVEYNIPDQLLQIKLPKFTLQPIVENCIVHAFTDEIQQPTITISCETADCYAYLTIRDNGCGTAQDPNMLPEERLEEKSECHIGLRNVHERLQLLFDDPSCGIRFQSTPHEGTQVTIVVRLSN